MVPWHDWLDSFGARLTRLRHERGLTQEQLADRSGLSVRAISSLECGARHPRRLTVERLATGLGLAPLERQQLIDAAADERRPLPPSPTAAPAPTIPLIGRDAQRDVLRRHLDGEGPPLLCVVGEPGIGKSRLLDEASGMAAARGWPVLSAGCRRGGEPYTPIVDALAGYAARMPAPALAALNRECPGIEVLLPEVAPPGARPAVPAGQRRRLGFDAAARFTRLIGTGPGPAVLVLDDMQWAGPAAADLLCHLVRHADGALRVVIAGRAGDLGLTSRLARCIADLARQGLLSRHRLAPLAPQDADRLVTAVAGGTALSRPTRGRILRRSAGLPLFLIDLTRAAQHDEEDLPDHLRVAVRQQLADLPDPGPAALRRLAWTGTTVPIDALADEASDQLLDALEVAVRRGILDETSRGYRFRYPLLRDVLLQDLGPTRRQLWREQKGTSRAQFGSARRPERK